ncbi:MAG: hypothetical protein ABIR57_10425, partial [Aeromicrobium sp.]
MSGKTSNVLTWARSRARALPHVAWRDQKIDELLTKQVKTARELAKAKRELSALSTASVQVPSFRRYLFAERRIHAHMRDHAADNQRNSLTRKLNSYSFAQSHGVAIPRIFDIWQEPESIDWDGLPDEVVIKSQTGSTGRGVFPLRRSPDGWTIVTKTDAIEPQNIAKR